MKVLKSLTFVIILLIIVVVMVSVFLLHTRFKKHGGFYLCESYRTCVPTDYR